MDKNKTIFTCSKCDAQFPKWSGRCSECGAWGTVVEGAPTPKNSHKSSPLPKFNQDKLIDFNQIDSRHFERLTLASNEINQIFGGGIVKGSLTLIGGEPGIGKSTLSLQILRELETKNAPLLYVSGEESAEQIKLRIDRLGYKPQNLKFLSETNVETIISAITDLKPQITIIDSIQTLYSSDVESESGNINQIRACTVKLVEVAKSTHVPIIITGHVTKDGTMAGPKTLEHLVDVVMYLEGDKYHEYRLLRCSKNRFGSTNEVAVLEMTQKGLEEVKNPTTIFLQQMESNTAGTVISCFMEGTRAFLVEVQALVTPTIFGFPQRKTSGYDSNRLQMITAVLFKRARLNLQNQDIHLNIVGGVKITEPAIDLAVALAIYSAFKNKPIKSTQVVFGELGLGGEIRPVPQLDKRLKAAEKLGFESVLIPKQKNETKTNLHCQIIKNISEIENI